MLARHFGIGATRMLEPYISRLAPPMCRTLLWPRRSSLGAGLVARKQPERGMLRTPFGE